MGRIWLAGEGGIGPENRGLSKKLKEDQGDITQHSHSFGGKAGWVGERFGGLVYTVITVTRSAPRGDQEGCPFQVARCDGATFISAAKAAAALPAPATYGAGAPRAPATQAAAQPTAARLCCWAQVPVPLLSTPPALALLPRLWRGGPGAASRRRPALASPQVAAQHRGLGQPASRVSLAPGQGLEHNRHNSSPQTPRQSQCQCRKASAAGQGAAGTEIRRVSASISGMCHCRQQ